MTKNFIKVYIATVFILFVIPLLFSEILLQQAGENLSFPQIIHRQLTRNSIYGSALTDNAYMYKLELLRQVKPDIIALGSSRVLQFREEFFKSRFVNCGLAMRSLHEGRIFITDMLRFHKPKVIIIGLDFWWFKENHHTLSEDDLALSRASIMPERFSIAKLTRPFYFLIKNKLSYTDISKALFTPTMSNGVTLFDNIGISAIKGAHGFRKDGSQLYSGQVFGINKKFYDEHFKRVLSRVKTGTARFQYGQEISQGKVKEFTEIVNLCKQNNIQLVLFVSPLAEPIYQAMMAKRNHEYDYVNTFREIVKTAPVEHYDYLGADQLGSNSCEFYDGYHGGDVTYARILFQISQANPHSAIMPFLNHNILNHSIQKYSGFAMIPFHPELYPRKEVDFLKLGCRKQIQDQVTR
jgi:hypothetical protein